MLGQRRWPGAALLVFVAGCGGDGPLAATEIALTVVRPEGLSLTQLEFVSSAGRQRVPESGGAALGAEATVRILLSDDVSGRPFDVQVWGLASGERKAAVRVEVVPRRQQTVAVRARLEPLPCGAGCVLGAKRCDADGVVTCVRDAGCTAWSAPVPCAADAPSCSFGQCSTACVDECQREGECESGFASFRCEDGDRDDCLDRNYASDCASTRCEGAGCEASCEDACALGETRCDGAGVARCGQFDADDCLEFGPTAPCGAGGCEAGACVERCTDECEASTCEDNVFEACGQFDLDPCLDLRPIACAPDRGCDGGGCDPQSGCQDGPRLCHRPPDNACVSENRMRVYRAVGACAPETGCAYAFDDRLCPNCPDCDLCAGVTCDAPSDPQCQAATGMCIDGRCQYPALEDGAECADEDPCTRDTCHAGRCVSEPMTCPRPGPPRCLDDTTRQTITGTGVCEEGRCRYTVRNETCPERCEGGQCVATCQPTETVVAPGGVASPGPSLAVGPDRSLHGLLSTDVGPPARVHLPWQGRWSVQAPPAPDTTQGSLALVASGGSLDAYGLARGEASYLQVWSHTSSQSFQPDHLVARAHSPALWGDGEARHGVVYRDLSGQLWGQVRRGPAQWGPGVQLSEGDAPVGDFAVAFDPKSGSVLVVYQRTGPVADLVYAVWPLGPTSPPSVRLFSGDHDRVAVAASRGGELHVLARPLGQSSLRYAQGTAARLAPRSTVSVRAQSFALAVGPHGAVHLVLLEGIGLRHGVAAAGGAFMFRNVATQLAPRSDGHLALVVGPTGVVDILFSDTQGRVRHRRVCP